MVVLRLGRRNTCISLGGGSTFWTPHDGPTSERLMAALLQNASWRPYLLDELKSFPDCFWRNILLLDGTMPSLLVAMLAALLEGDQSSLLDGIA